MRMLTNDELNLIAGGNSSSDSVVVTGYRYYEDMSWWYYDWTMDTGGGGGGTDPIEAEEPNDTPCVETTFSTAGVTTTDANRAALAASNAIAALNDETYEYSSVIFAFNGTVGWTEPYTDNQTGHVDWINSDILSHIPYGAVIIGIVHNHPDEPGITDGYPSGIGTAVGDWDSYNQLVGTSNLGRGITVDPNMLLYIYTNEDDRTRVYDKTDKSQDNNSCSLQ